MNGAIVLLDLAARTTVVVALALGAVMLLRRQSAAVRHWVLAVALTCAAALPVLQFVIPAELLADGWGMSLRTGPSSDGQLAVRADEGAASGQTAAGVEARGRGLAESRRSSPQFWRALSLSWLAGLTLGLGVLLSGLLRLAWLAAHSRVAAHGRCLALSSEMSRALGLRRPVQFLETDHPALLLTWGVFRPKILLPRAARDWSDELCRIVLAHELAHIRRNDWLMQLLAELLRYVYWFNPLVWIATTRLRHESEQACDDAVLQSGVAGPDYAAHLLNLARAARTSSRIWLPAPAMARPSSLERRIVAMLDNRISRTSPHPAARFVTSGALVALTLLLAGVALFAQTFATLSGSVLDPSNRVLPNTTLALTNMQTRAKYEVHSDSTGRFEFVGLPAGRYSLEASQPGFAAFKGELTISGQRLQKDLALEVGSLQETITVMPRSRARATENQQPAGAPPPRPPISRQAVANCAPTAIGGNLRPPTKVFDLKPVYPDDLAQAGIGGVVLLAARIQPEGNVGEVTVTSSVDPALDAAAIEAVRRWQFTPTLLNCQPIEVKMAVHVSFRSQ